MTIAIPISQERISPLLDTAARLLLVTRRRGKEVARKEFILNPQPPEELARSVAELRVDVLLCAALSEELTAGTGTVWRARYTASLRRNRRRAASLLL